MPLVTRVTLNRAFIAAGGMRSPVGLVLLWQNGRPHSVDLWYN